ncbi:arylformamidase [Shouchella clausii]|uniref:arylformamidase n=1 Tax=Shouchella clausii TaxID=79880 RepID=UPI00226D1FCB|nr:arylformamidase [Shouchella clausii]MCY1102940.1 arylformamidase [Shouchella clausii]
MNHANNMNRWIDVSQPLNEKLAHWPGDLPYSYQLTFSKQQTGSVNIGQMAMSVHSGTHVDAPFHFKDDGAKISDLDINVFIGKARVVDLSKYEKIDQAALRSLHLEGVKRLLIKTAVPNQATAFPENIPYVTPDGAAYMKEKGIILIGVDVPSVDPLDSKELEGHHALADNGISILENLMLDKVEEGDYELIALPLPMEEADGSPVRAVIRAI